MTTTSGDVTSFVISTGVGVSAAQYYIQGVLYSSAEQLITLTASDATFDRIDVIVVNTSGQVDKVTGVATSSPSEPDIDPATQLQLAFIIVYAASSSPIIHSQTIYSEDAGSPTEWNWSSTGSTWNLTSTNNPFAGTKDIEATALGANAYAQGMATGTVSLGTYTQLNFYVRSKATWNSGRGLYVAWYSNGVRKGNNVFLAHGFYNFNSDNTTDYQLVSIPISQFAVPNGTTVNQLRFTRVGGAIGFYLDEIIVTDSGLTSTPVGLTQEQADARYAQLAFKTIQVSGQGDVVADAKDDTLTFVAGSGITINTATGTDSITFASSGIPTDGWISKTAETWTFVTGTTSPEFAFDVATNVTGTYALGQRIKLDQTTTKYFIVTNVAYTSFTRVTMYGGTDYSLVNAAISNNYYSMMKCPLGFPLDPAKWTISAIDTTQRSQSSASQNVWYNFGTVTISIPIGIWYVDYQVNAQVNFGSGGGGLYTTLSTANNSESDTQFTTYHSTGGSVVAMFNHRSKTLTLAAKTSYYLNTKMDSPAGSTTLYNRGDNGATLLSALCALL